MKKALLLLLALTAIIYFWLFQNKNTPNQTAEEKVLSKTHTSISQLNITHGEEVPKSSASDNDIQIPFETNETETSTSTNPDDNIVTCPVIEKEEQSDLEREQAH